MRATLSNARIWILALGLLASAGCAARSTAPGLPRGVLEAREGVATFYGQEFQGKTTASGDVFDPNALTMAHRSLPFGTRVRVTNTENHRSVEVTVTDRGPFVAGRIADLSLAAARQIGMVAHGVVEATLEVLRLGSGRAP